MVQHVKTLVVEVISLRAALHFVTRAIWGLLPLRKLLEISLMMTIHLSFFDGLILKIVYKGKII
jgi:hypothetical protein